MEHEFDPEKEIEKKKSYDEFLREFKNELKREELFLRENTKSSLREDIHE